MAEWRVQDGGDIRDLTEDALRAKLRKGDLSGAELARRVSDSEWKPLHTLPIFREEVPFTGGSADVARRRLLVPLVWHVGIFAAVGTFATGWQWWMAFWGVGVALHVIGAGQKWLGLRRQTRAAAGTGSTKGAAKAEVKTAAAADPLDAELETAFAALETAAKGRADIDVAATKRDAMALAKRRAALLPLCDPATRERLEAEQDRVIAEEERSSAELKDVLRQQAVALQQRLDAMDESRAMVTRLEARLRTVLHEVENLRLQLARAGTEDMPAPSLGEEVRRMQREIAADAEAEAAVRNAGPRKQPT